MEIKEWRAFEGRNVHCKRPVTELTVDLGPYAEVTTAMLKGFPERLLAGLPGLMEHVCGLRFKGGFAQRLHEGTMLGHVLEHVALELLHGIGEEVTYGKTRQIGRGSLYMVVFEHGTRCGGAAAGRAAAEAALAEILRLVRDEQANFDATLKRLAQTCAPWTLGPSTWAIWRAAQARHIPVRRVGLGCMLELGYGKHMRRVNATVSDATSLIAADVASDKGFTKYLLQRVGIPVPAGREVTTLEEARSAAVELGFPVVLKPFNGNQGKGVTVGVVSLAQVDRAFEVAQNYSGRCLLEREVPGRHFRVLVVGDEVVAASERLRPEVIGDGRHTIRQLVQRLNEDPRRGEDHEKPLTKVRLDTAALMCVAKQGLGPEDVPAPGHRVTILESANLSTGGSAMDCTSSLCPDNERLCVRAARAIGLDIAGVDLVAQDLGRPIQDGSGMVLEVNAAPGIRMHLHPTLGSPQPVAEKIVEHLFPRGASGRVPIVAITGTNGKTTTTRIVGHILGRCGYLVGMTTTDGIYIGSQQVARGDDTGPLSALRVLTDPAVEAAVLETARGGLRRGGLAFDEADVGVYLNLTGDHLGQDGVNTMEELQRVKTVVTEAVSPRGYAVLNADDSWCLAAGERAGGSRILFSRSSDNLAVRKHCMNHGRAVFARQGHIVLALGSDEVALVALDELPFTLQGRAWPMVENALAATAACWALGLEQEGISAALREFDGGPSHNPGRFNLYHRQDGVQVMVDYGHNKAALQAVISTARAFQPRRLIGVVGLPGDRRNEDAVELGRVAGRGFDLLFIKEDHDRRGRTPGEVARLIAQGALQAGLDETQMTTVLDQGAAIGQALGEAQPGDMVLVFYEHLEAALRSVDEVQARATPTQLAVAHK